MLCSSITRHVDAPELNYLRETELLIWPELNLVALQVKKAHTHIHVHQHLHTELQSRKYGATRIFSFCSLATQIIEKS